MVTPTLRSTRPGHAVDVEASVMAAEKHVAPAGQHTVDETAADDFDAALEGAQAPASATPTSAPAETAVATTAPRAVASGGAFADVSDHTLMGDWDSTDVRFPALRIVNGSGPLTKLYNQGTLLFGDDVLFEAPDPRKQGKSPALRLVPLTLRKRFRQNLTPEEQQAGVMPNIVDSIREVEEMGGTVAWINGEKPSWSPCATMLALLEQPEDSQHPGFSMEIGAKMYAPALYYASGTAYGSSAKLIFNAALNVLQVPVTDEAGLPKRGAGGLIVKRPYLSKRIWTFSVVKRSFGKGQQEFTVFTPEMRLTTEETSSELREGIASLLHSVDVDRASAVGE